MYKFNYLIILIFLATLSPLKADDAAVEKIMADQKAACDKNTAMEWSSSLNRCVGKQAARETRHAAQACGALKTVEEKEKCNLALAEKNSGLSSDPSKLDQGNYNKSMIMNSIGAVYNVVTAILNHGKQGTNSSCTSKTIFGVTSTAGLASDFFLKSKAKKKVKELEDKFKLDKASGTHEAQIRALEYLKEEQETVAEIASMEKKRNLALIMGYGLAAGWAVYEQTPYGQNPDCNRAPAAEKTDTKLAENSKTDVIGKAEEAPNTPPDQVKK